MFKEHKTKIIFGECFLMLVFEQIFFLEGFYEQSVNSSIKSYSNNLILQK